METKSIEERARQIVFSYPRTGKVYYTAYVHGAKDQDSIARKEERERCINAAQNFICAGCIGEGKIDRCQIREECTKRGRMMRIRKAMEGGEV